MKQHLLPLFAIFLTLMNLGADQTTSGEVSVNSAHSAVDEERPGIRFAESTFDFGTVDSGTPVRHDFVFTNTGNQLLEITQVRPACGCTTTGTWDRQVKPGQTGRIPVQFNTQGFGGTISKPISVVCNDPTQTNVTLQLKGTIWKPIDVGPSYAIFNPAPDVQTNETRVIKIVNREKEPLVLAEPVCTNRQFQTELKALKAGQEYELWVTALRPFGVSSTSTAITLDTSSKKMPTVTVTAFLTPRPVIAVSPPQIMLPAGTLTNSAQFTVTIQNNTTNAVSLSDPTVNAEDIDLQLKELQSGRLFTLTAKFPPGFKTEAGKLIVASVNSSHPQFSTIRIPVLQSPAPAGSIKTASPASGAASIQTVSLKTPAPVVSHAAVVGQ